MVETDVTTVQLTGLTPNTQYALYSTALTVTTDTKIESTPSETLIAWTDPAFPAFVEVSFSDPICYSHDLSSGSNHPSYQYGNRR